jgi:hypothetical protein
MLQQQQVSVMAERVASAGLAARLALARELPDRIR